ncbi:MAG: helix-turn-helix transcriptional regulator [Clostridiales bacterium]|nr:helix-turn-helix transcriptional regulator [Clostridiales bacterium]
MSLGNNIKRYRRSLGITQEELAGILCITSQAVSRWESEAGMPDITQIVPLAKALNVSTDALFGLGEESYDRDLAERVIFEANTLRDTGDPAEGALAAAEYLDSQCEENIFNYGIMCRYVQAVAHMSRFVNSNNVYYSGLFGDDQKKWRHMVKSAENRAMQVIRYSGEKDLADSCHYALGWLYWHIGEYDKGRAHIGELPSIKSNMLQETLLPYYVYAGSDKSMEGWKAQVRDNYQNFIRAINKQIVYSAESMMWTCPVAEVEECCLWGLKIMDSFMENPKMKAYCQGFYRDTSKFLIAAYLRSGDASKAAAEWKRLGSVIEEYVGFCAKTCAPGKDQVIRDFGEHAWDNMSKYKEDWIGGKKEFMLGQLKSWSDGKVFAEFESLI